MTHEKTAEQVKADSTLADAVQNALRAYDIEDGFTLVDFVVLIAAQRLDADGTIYTTHPVLMRDGDIPWYRIMGLMEIHKKLMDNAIMMGSDNG